MKKADLELFASICVLERNRLREEWKTMKKIILGFGGALLVIAVIAGFFYFAREPGIRPEQNETVSDPQMLLIPRWFLASLRLNDIAVEIPAGQQEMTLQFENGGQANGTGGCNSFGVTYQADYDGSLSFGPIASTRMFCEGMMEQENVYFEALSRVAQFRIAEGKLFMTSADGQTELVFTRPPK